MGKPRNTFVVPGQRRKSANNWQPESIVLYHSCEQFGRTLVGQDIPGVEIMRPLEVSLAKISEECPKNGYVRELDA